MSIDAVAREQAVAEALGSNRHLAMLSTLCLEVLRIAENPQSPAQAMHDVVSQDPALCLLVLKVVNSPFYGFPGQIDSLHRAIVLMGLAAVKNVAIAASLTPAFQGPPLSACFSPRDLWTHSAAVGTAARMIAATVKPELAEEAFLAGLIHDIGIMAELQCDRRKLAAVLARFHAGAATNFVTAEEEVFRANHQDFGAVLSKRWNLPRALVLVTGWHHHPMDLPVHERGLPAMVYVADRLAAVCHIGFGLDVSSPDIDADVLNQLGLTREHIDAIKARLPDATEELQTRLAA